MALLRHAASLLALFSVESHDRIDNELAVIGRALDQIYPEPGVTSITPVPVTPVSGQKKTPPRR